MNMTMPCFPTMPTRRLAAVCAVVIAAHAAAVGALWVTFTDSAPHVVQAEVLMEWVNPSPTNTPKPQRLPAAPAQPATTPTPKPVAVRSAPQAEPRATQTDAPAVITPTPSATAGSDVSARTAPQASPPTGAAASAPAPAAPAAPKMELPSASADYLNNPRPPYPSMSKRLREQGKVTLRVLIDTNGTASKAEIHTSSGYDRLDQAALQAVLGWRYVPGKRNGVPETMWFNIPINFVLE